MMSCSLLVNKWLRMQSTGCYGSKCCQCHLVSLQRDSYRHLVGFNNVWRGVVSLA